MAVPGAGKGQFLELGKLEYSESSGGNSQLITKCAETGQD